MLTVTENGKGRRSDIDTYRITARGGKGIRNYDASKDKVAAVNSEDRIIGRTGGCSVAAVCMAAEASRSACSFSCTGGCGVTRYSSEA